MTATTDQREAIVAALKAFADRPLADAARGLFATLGYKSDRRLPLRPATAAGFLAAFDPDGKLNRERALIDDWLAVEFLFQLTDAEVQAAGGQLSLFESAGVFDGTIIESYVFLAIELRTQQCSRTRLAGIVREVNRLFRMPVFILFRHGDRLTLAVIHRRLSKLDEDRDVLEKVTLVKDIRLLNPHRAHVEILSELALDSLRLRFAPDNFVKLHNAWRKTLDTSELNRRFYKELANWYFWALQTAHFPAQAQKDADGRDSISVIRLVTRLVFCWFLREKGIVPRELFEERHVRDLLTSLDPDDNSYYTAILQNLFFATLNTEMDAAGQPPSRRFARRRTEDHMVHQYWRHDERLRDPAALEVLLRPVPFLNGGLFECLDERIDAGNSSREIRVDGFSTDPAKQPQVPNRLFFGPDQAADLSQAYGDSRYTQEKVSPLIAILDRYKFTVAENTPIEQEVALDPELLGLVFENLLAAYNPETGTIARKATGSFYTPRYVVEFMVDEALLAHLDAHLRRATPEAADVESRLRALLAYRDEPTGFADHERSALVGAIDQLRLLDPACGSGAFPMGALHKLVYVLGRLDPQNSILKRLQTAKAGSDSAARQAVEEAFARGHDDYARKLVLIENGLFGVDIQPIAVQIAKLRCFVSLVVEQQLADALPNRGIIPLPNLETNFITANTLFRPHFRGQGLLTQRRVEAKKAELRDVRHRHFLARKYSDKKALRKEDARLRRELVGLLEAEDALTGPEARLLADWNPYHADQSAPFFDPDWMFNLSARPRAPVATVPGNFSLVNELEGQMELLDAPPPGSAEGFFDIVIGNPPYVRQEELKSQVAFPGTKIQRPLKDALKPEYFCYTGTSDLYVYFCEKAIDLLRVGGVLSFITSNKYFRAAYGEKLRLFLANACEIRVLIDFGDAAVFTAIAYPSILIARKTRETEDKKALAYELEGKTATQRKRQEVGLLVRAMNWDAGQTIEEFPRILAETGLKLPQCELRKDGWRLESDVTLRLLEKMRRAGVPLGEHVHGRFYRGLLTGLNEAFVVDRATRDRLIAEHPSSDNVLKPFLRGRDVKRWSVEFGDQYLIKVESSENKTHPWSGKPSLEAEAIFARVYPAIYAFMQPMRERLIARTDQGKYFWELRSCAYWQEFEQPKILYPDIYEHQSFAYDMAGYFLANTCYFIPTRESWLTGLLNSSAVEWFYGHVSNRIRGGYLRAFSDYIQQIPIPAAGPGATREAAALVACLLHLTATRISPAVSPGPSGALSIAFFEQWINGLVYELFFGDELHNRGIQLFDETAKLGLPDLASLAEGERLPRLTDLFERAYDINSPLRAMLFSLQSLETIRIIEGEK